MYTTSNSYNSVYIYIFIIIIIIIITIIIIIISSSSSRGLDPLRILPATCNYYINYFLVIPLLQWSYITKTY